jgi:hypothetical protein
MIEPVAAALTEPTSAQMSDRRVLSGKRTSHLRAPGVAISAPSIQPSGASIGVTDTHPTAYSASRPPTIADKVLLFRSNRLRRDSPAASILRARTCRRQCMSLGRTQKCCTQSV